MLDIAEKIVVIANGKITAQGDKNSILPEMLNASEGCRFFEKKK